MDHKKISILSRSRSFLIKSAVSIGLFAVLLGFIIDSTKIPASLKIQNSLRSACPWLSESEILSVVNNSNQYELINFLKSKKGDSFTNVEIADLARNGDLEKALILKIPQNILSKEEQEALVLFNQSILEKNNPTHLSQLQTYALRKEPIRFASELLADAMSAKGEKEKANQFYKLELKNFPQSYHSKSKIIISLIESGDLKEAKELFNDQELRESLDFKTFKIIAIKLNEWTALTIKSYYLAFSELSLPWIMVTLFTALIWFLIITNLGQLSGDTFIRLTLYGSAFISGFLSTFVVLGLVYWQENKFGLQINGETVNDIIYCICGIGLREELIKVVFFSPFLLILRKRRIPMEALACAACVGLGFACSENILYFGSGFESAVFPRFLTANFLHTSLTAIVGISMYHWIINPLRGWDNFLKDFVIVVTAHGAYDALVGIVPKLANSMGILSIVIFAVIANSYLNVAKKIRSGPPSKISPLGIFIIGSSLLIGVSWNLACYLYNFREVILLIGQSTLSLGALGFIFINQFRNE